VATVAVATHVLLHVEDGHISRQTSGQIIIYGHLLILMSLSMVAASIRLLFCMGSNILLSYILFLDLYCSIFCQLQLFFINSGLNKHHLKIYHFCLYLGILPVFINLIVVVPNIMIIGQLTLFFISYAKY